VQKDCATKAASALAGDLNTVCIVNQKVSIAMVNDQEPCPISSMAYSSLTSSSTIPTSLGGLMGSQGNGSNAASGNHQDTSTTQNSTLNNTQNSSSQNEVLNNTLNSSISTDIAKTKTLQNDGTNHRAQEETIQSNKQRDIESPEEKHKVVIMLVAVSISVVIILVIFVGGLAFWLRKERQAQNDLTQDVTNVPRLENIIPRAFINGRTHDSRRFIKPTPKDAPTDESRIDFGNDLSNISGIKLVD